MDATGQYIPNMHLSHIKHFLWHCHRGPPLTPLWTLHASALDPLGLHSSPTLCFLCKGPEAEECLLYLSNSKEAPGLPQWLSGKESTCQCRRWVQSLGQEDPLENAPVFLPGKSREQRSLVGYSPWGCKRAGYDLMTINKQQQLKMSHRPNIRSKTIKC